MTARRSILPSCRSARNCARGWRAGAARFQKSFETEIDLDAFAAEGRAIARAVKAELPDWSIVYFDEAAAARAELPGRAAPTYEVEIP